MNTSKDIFAKLLLHKRGIFSLHRIDFGLLLNRLRLNYLYFGFSRVLM